MGQKVNPIGYRIGVSKTSSSTWFSQKNYVEYLVEDYKIRGFIEKNISGHLCLRLRLLDFLKW